MGRRFVTGQTDRTAFRRGVYCVPSLVVVFLALAVALGATSTSGQIELTITPTMAKGVAGAPVVIVEFSDYQ